VVLAVSGLGCDSAGERSAPTQAPATSVTEPASPITTVTIAAASTIDSATMLTVPDTTSAVESDVRELLEAAFVDQRGGAAVLVVSDGVVTELGVGERNELGKAMTASTPSRVGSLSKPFVAAMVLQLVDEGRVDLDSPLGDYLPDTPVGAEVTIRDLLRHHSGLPDYTVRGDFEEDTLADRERRFEPGELLAYIEPVAPGPAGERFAYSNTNYVLLGQLIEHLDGVDLNTALRARITEPLDLEVTRIDNGEPSAVAGLASGWSPGVVSGQPDAPYASIATGAWAAGGLVSTTGELATFLAALFDGEVISSASCV
jgi:D-alanyl-D-alanine carboxypeptidase